MTHKSKNHVLTYISNLKNKLVENSCVSSVIDIERLEINESEFNFNKYRDNITKSLNKNLMRLRKCEGYTNLNETIDLDFEITNADSFNNCDLMETASCNICLTVYLCTNYTILDNSSCSEFYRRFINKNLYYRGHSDFEFALIPSFYRALDIKEAKACIDFDFIKKRYKEIGLLNKDNLNFKKIALFQHSIAYSPLLDITSDKNIATIFATCGQGMNPNDYYKKDAALYTFEFIDQNIPRDKRIKEINIIMFKNKIDLLTKANENSYFFELNYKDFLIDYSVINDCGNDRMKAQKGAFLFIKKAYCINGVFMIPNSQISITKERISPDKKRDLYSGIIKKNDKLDIKYLMDPYLKFSEYYKK